MTKRPTSVVLVGREVGKKSGKGKDGKDGKDGKKEDDKDGAAEWGEVYAELVKVVRKAGRGVRI